METPEQAKKKLQQSFAVGIASIAALALGAAALWPRGEEIEKDRRVTTSEASAKRNASGSHSPSSQRISLPSGPSAAQVPPAGGGIEAEQSALDEPAPKITVEVKPDEARAFQIDQEHRRAALEQDLKARLTPEQQRAREQGQKIWQERLRAQQ